MSEYNRGNSFSKFGQVNPIKDAITKLQQDVIAIKADLTGVEDTYIPLIEGTSLPTFVLATHQRRAHTTSDDDRLHIGLDSGWNRIITANHNDEVFIDRSETHPALAYRKNLNELWIR